MDYANEVLDFVVMDLEHQSLLVLLLLVDGSLSPSFSMNFSSRNLLRASR